MVILEKLRKEEIRLWKEPKMSEIGTKNIELDELDEIIQSNFFNPIAILERWFCEEEDNPDFFNHLSKLTGNVSEWDKGRVFDDTSELKWERKNSRFNLVLLRDYENISNGWSKEKANLDGSREILLWGDQIGKYLFSWDKIQGNDNEKLIEFLMQYFNIEWIKAAKINKNDDGKIIWVTTDTNSLSLTLNNEKTNVNLKIDDGRTDKFIVKTENGDLNIYNKNEWYEKQIPRIFEYPVANGARAYVVLNEYLLEDGSKYYRFKEVISK